MKYKAVRFIDPDLQDPFPSYDPWFIIGRTDDGMWVNVDYGGEPTKKICLYTFRSDTQYAINNFPC